MKSVVDKIKEQEEKRYGRTFDIDFVTVLNYYRKNFDGKKFSLNEVSDLIQTQKKTFGFYDGTSKAVCIFDKNYKLQLFLDNPIKYFFKKTISEDSLITFVLYHEIRHVLQFENKENFSEYERFCINYLDNIIEGDKFNKDTHDSLFCEIDADLYSSHESLKIYSTKNTPENEYFKNIYCKSLYRRDIYDFDTIFKYFCIELEKNKFKKNEYQKEEYFKIFWNEDGTFKPIKDILNNDNLNDNLVVIKILSSTYFLNKLNIDDLNQKEIQIISDAIDYNRDIYIYKRINEIKRIYNIGYLNEYEYKKSLLKLEKEMYVKDKFKESLSHRSR